MRLAGFNASGVNTEPMNGQGIYPAQASHSLAWNVTSQVAPRTLSLPFDIRSALLKQLGVTWNESQIAQAFSGATWDVRAYTQQTRAISWDDRIELSKYLPVLFDLRDIAANPIDVSWDESQIANNALGVVWDDTVPVLKSAELHWADYAQLLKVERFIWNDPFAVRNHSAVSRRAGNTGLVPRSPGQPLWRSGKNLSLVRHTSTSKIG